MSMYDWSRLTRLQVGRYAEYFVKMEFTLHGFEVYEPEVDDHGIDFIVRRGGDKYYEIQVKSIRRTLGKTSYVFITKSKFKPREGLLAAIVILEDATAPTLFLISSKSWMAPNALLVDHNYEGKKSRPEWGINISQRNIGLLQQHEFARVVRRL